MNRKAYFPHTQTDIRKILVVCAITFLALTRREGFPLPKEKVAQIDYLSTEYATELPPEPTESTTELAALDEDAILEQLTTEILQIFSGLDAESSSEPIAPTDKEHDVANDFVQLCETSATFCEKTFWNGTFTPREKSEYFGQITTIVSGIDTIAQRGKALEQVFSQILINQAKGNRRGSSGRTKLTMNLGGMEYDDEFRQVFTHEVGHIVDLGSLQGKNKNQSALYTEFGKKAFALDDPSLEYYKYSRQSESIRKS
ncbi:MAG: hypothetical protein LBU27_07465 [Candidatus Peribacteria bacterium]|jgi:hypothetical protein|nr:hypothetical protein [Candidatus Peribacteria bacterium]